jgi:hypothetical protein
VKFKTLTVGSKRLSDFSELNEASVFRSSVNRPKPLLSKGNYEFASSKALNFNFLRKERLYTKLKYSRSPAYDIVSGGAAALLAGFAGFLISEKFGFELADSGDFYYFFMYVVFLSFSMRPLLTTVSSKGSLTQLFTVKPILSFFSVIASLLLKKIR